EPKISSAPKPPRTRGRRAVVDRRGITVVRGLENVGMLKGPDFAGLIGPVACRLWGPPNEEREGELRWGTRGSRKVDLNKGTWYDFENNEGGGVLDLIVKETGCSDKRAAHAWLVENRFVDAPANGLGRIVAQYDYTDEQGELLFQVVRFKPKNFRQRRPDGRDWIWNLNGVRRVPFQLPKVLAAVKAGKVIFIPEGEKDCQAVMKLGLVATTCPGGANKWRQEYNEYFRDADCVILPDNDDPGRSHAEHVAKSLHEVARRVRVVDLAQHWPEADEKADITKWIKYGGGAVEKLEEITDATSDWEPTVETKDSVATDNDTLLDELAGLSPIEYGQAREEAAETLGVGVKFLDEEIKHRRKRLKTAKPKPAPAPDIKALEKSARKIIDCDDVLQLFENDFAEVVAGEKKLGQLLYLIATTRLLGQGMHAAIKGTSAGGEANLPKRGVGVFLPGERV